MSCNKEKVAAVLADIDNLTPTELKSKLKAAISPTQRVGVAFDDNNSDNYDFVEGMRGVRWFPYTELVRLGGAFMKGVRANGRWYAIDKNGLPIAGTGHIGSATPISLTRVAA